MKKQGAKTAVPRLRFPEFRQDDPWAVRALGSDATFEKGRGVSKAEVDPNGRHQCIRYGELYTRYGEVIREVVSRTNAADATLFFSRINDVIVPASGETKEDIATASCVLLDGVALGGDLNVIRSPHNGVFLSYLLNGSKRRELAKVAQGDTVVHLYPRQLAVLWVAFPDSVEQQKIADCLTSLDEVIAAQGRKVEALKAHKRGLMQQLFPREGETRPRLRFPEFRNVKDWVETNIGSVARLQNGYAFKSSEYEDEGAYQIITIANVQQGSLAIESARKISTLPADIQRHQILDIGDILISMTGNVGRVCHVNLTGLLLNQRVGKLAPEMIHQSFFYQLLQRDEFRGAMQLKAAGGAQGNLSAGDIAGYAFNMPSESDEQQCIADCLGSFDGLITAESAYLASLKIHKQGLMQQLFPIP